MALPALYLLVLFSMLPLLQASRCPRGSFCPMGVDCDKDLNLCQSGMCTYGANRSLCDDGIRVEFTRVVYSIPEGAQIDAILRIDKPLDCCPFSVQIRVDQQTATGADFDYPRSGYIQVVFPPAKKQTVTIPLKTKDDKISEMTETFRLTIVDISLPRGVSVGNMRSAEIEIVDNDPVCVRFDRPSYTVSENSPLSVALVLTAVASYEISVEITTVSMEATAGCDYDDTPLSVKIKPGSTRTTFNFDINNDDVHEGSESFNLVIGDVTNPATHCNSYRTTITIRDNEPQISMSFDQSSYFVDEDGGSISPVLELSEPAPCCITVYVELTDKTATGGGVDYGNQEIDMYEYTFSAGETCSTPSIPISIINDTTSERDETFTISVIEISVPFNVRLSRKSAQITIRDNDIEVCFEKRNYEIIETDGPLKVRLELDKPAVEDTTILIFDIAETAIPGDYVRGPYDVTFKKNQRKSEPFDIIINGTDGYTGNKKFYLDIGFASLSNGLVACMPPSVPVTILDFDYGVCFHTDVITVTEGERVELLLATTRKLSRSKYVTFQYGGVDGYPHTASSSGSGSDYTPVRGTSITTTSTIFINTRGDNTLERDERFSIAIDPKILPVGLPPSCYTTVVVTILNDDVSAVYFERNNYANVNKNELLKPVIAFSNQIDYKVQGIINTEDDTAVNNEDYHILNDNPIQIGPGKNKLLSVDAVDDDIVEELKEYFTIRLIDVYDPNIYIDEARNYTQITIHDDDISEVQIIQERLDFTKGIYQDCTVRIEYTDNPVPINYTLPSGNRTIDLNGDVKMATVCIPNKLYDESRSRYRNNNLPVLTDDKRVKIIPLRDC